MAGASLGAPLITLDTSGVVAALNRGDAQHEPVREALVAERGPLILPAGVLGEMGYMIESMLGIDALRRFVGDVATGFYELDCCGADMPRVGELLDRYQELKLGFADAAVAACAERRGGRVLTLDARDFGPLQRAGLVQVVPSLG